MKEVIKFMVHLLVVAVIKRAQSQCGLNPGKVH